MRLSAKNFFLLLGVLFLMGIIFLCIYFVSFQKKNKADEKNVTVKEKSVNEKPKEGENKIYTITGFVEKIDNSTGIIIVQSYNLNDDRKYTFKIDNNTKFSALSMGKGDKSSSNNVSFNNLKTRDRISVDVNSDSINNNEVKALSIEVMTLPFSVDSK